MKSVTEFNLKEKKVLVRCDFNVPIKNGIVLDDFRIRQSISTISYLIKKQAKIILISHLGRPDGKVNKEYSLRQIVPTLEKLLKRDVKFLDDCIGKKVEDEINKMGPGDVILLENLRFHKGEEENNDCFTGKLIKLGEVYINDAFSVCHRKHASIVGIPKYLPSGSGLLLEDEINALSKVSNNPERPLVTIIGGAKILSKTNVINHFLSVADHILLGGKIANIILQAKGVSIGISGFSPEIIEKVEDIKLTNISLHLPIDVAVCLQGAKEGYVRYSAIGNVHKDEHIFDLGPETVKIFSKIIEKAKTVFWSGPLGYVEDKRFVKSSLAIANKIIESGAFSVVGGGDTDAFLAKYKLREQFSHVSTGGGAMLMYLSGRELPGIKALL